MNIPEKMKKKVFKKVFLSKKFSGKTFLNTQILRSPLTCIGSKNGAHHRFQRKILVYMGMCPEKFSHKCIVRHRYLKASHFSWL